MSDYGLKQYLGGIMGDAQGAVTITKCHNSGDVLSDQETCNASEVNLGGIMGGIYNPEKWECKIPIIQDILRKNSIPSAESVELSQTADGQILRSKIQQIMELFNMP